MGSHDAWPPEEISRTASTESLMSNASLSSTLSRLGPPPSQTPPQPPGASTATHTTAYRQPTVPSRVAPPFMPAPPLPAPMQHRGGAVTAAHRAGADPEQQSEHQRQLTLFRSRVARHTVTLAMDASWVYFDCGPRDRAAPPVLFLHGMSGTAQSFFQQMLSLSASQLV